MKAGEILCETICVSLLAAKTSICDVSPRRQSPGRATIPAMLARSAHRKLRSALRSSSHRRTAAASSDPAPPAKLTHLDGSNRARMVDVSGKAATSRTARASARVHLGPDVYASVAASLSSRGGGSAKGDVLTVAQLAGIQAAKQTASLIPLCHPLALSHVGVCARLAPPDAILIDAEAATDAQTGVEMEAMTAASVAALTVYDMVKGVAKGVSVTHVRLEEKRGGKSGDYVREE